MWAGIQMRIFALGLWAGERNDREKRGRRKGQDRRKERGRKKVRHQILEADAALDGSRTLKRHCTDSSHCD